MITMRFSRFQLAQRLVDTTKNVSQHFHFLPCRASRFRKPNKHAFYAVIGTVRKNDLHIVLVVLDEMRVL